MRYLFSFIIALTVTLLAPLGAFAQTTIFTAALGGVNTGNNGISFAINVTASSGTLGKISATLNAAGGALTVGNVYVCQAATAPSCSDTPQHLFFATANSSGSFTTSVTTDFDAYATVGTNYIICFEITAGGNNATDTSAALATYFFVGSGVCSGATRTTGWSQIGGAGLDISLSQIQTQSAGGAVVKNRALLGVGN